MQTKQIKVSDKNIYDKCPSDVLSEIIKSKFSKSMESIIVSVGGPGGSGKSTFSKKLAKKLNASLIKLDNYKTERKIRDKAEIFGPHPDANHMELIKEHYSLIKESKEIEIPVYNSEVGYIDRLEPFVPSKFNVMDGEISTYEDFKDKSDFSIFIDSDWLTQLNTRINRDIKIRNYTKEKAINVFLNSNLREFEKYGAHTKHWCDAILFCNEKYELSIDSISEEYL